MRVESQNPEPRKRPGAFANQLAMAMELPVLMVVSVVMGAGIGLLLDRSLHTVPIFAIVGGLFGFGAGIWGILKRLSSARANGGIGRGDK